MRVAAGWWALVALAAALIHFVVDRGNVAFFGHGVISILMTWFAIPLGVVLVGVWTFIHVGRRFRSSDSRAWSIAAGSAVVTAAAVVAMGAVVVAGFTWWL